MASISTDVNGNRTIQFVACDGKRRSIRLGKMPLRNVEAVKVRVEALNSANFAGQAIDPETALWLSKRDKGLIEKLAAVGLIPEREVKTIEQLCNSYLEARSDLTKWRSRNNLEQTRKWLLKHFPADKRIGDITEGDTVQWRALLMKHLSENTARIHCRRAKEFFRYALQMRWITESPFAAMKGCSVKATSDRRHFVSREDTEKLIAECVTNEEKLIIALARYAGIRTPSETFALRWDGVLWDQGKMTITSPKTAHHPGQESRIIPIFPEVAPYLQKAWDEAPEGENRVVWQSGKNADKNLRTKFMRLCRRAGVKPWPKPYHAMRASRETELCKEHPLHVVTSWIGNSAAIAAKHYLQVVEADFAKALGRDESGAKSGAWLVRKAVQQTATVNAGNSQENQSSLEIPRDCWVLRDAEASEKIVNKRTVPPRGFEPLLPD